MESIIIGSGGFAKEVFSFLKEKNKKIKGFISKDIGDVDGIPILGGDEILSELIKKGELEVYVDMKSKTKKKIIRIC